jgi:hypothetical protein
LAVSLDAVLEIIEKSSETGQFELLAGLSKVDSKLRWGPCGGNDTGPEHLSSGAYVQRLADNHNSVRFVVNRQPEFSSPSPAGNDTSVVFETENWGGQRKYVRFQFKQVTRASQWVLVDTCYSPLPVFRIPDTARLRDSWEHISYRTRRFVADRKCHEAETFLKAMEKRFPDFQHRTYLYDPMWLLVAKCRAEG